MAEAAIVVSPNVVARRLGLTAMSDGQVLRVTDAIIDAQDAVEAELNRPLFAVTVVLAGQQPKPGYLDLLLADAWSTDFDDDYTVTTVTAEGGGLYTVTFSVGLNGPGERAIVRYVTAHAAEALRTDPGSGLGKLAVRSLSAEGQSISYDTAQPKGDGAGALPTLKSLRAFKRFGVYKANRPPTAPWPMLSNPIGWTPR